jgi:hypothetical protein
LLKQSVSSGNKNVTSTGHVLRRVHQIVTEYTDQPDDESTVSFGNTVLSGNEELKTAQQACRATNL